MKTDTVRATLKETVIGGTSKAWTLLVSTRTMLDTSSAQPTPSLTYWCGVNIAGGRDQICEGGGASSSNVSFSANSNFTRYFPSTAGKTVFPMVQISMLWSGGPTPAVHTAKFRGWDVTVSSTSTKLAATTGTGD